MSGGRRLEPRRASQRLRQLIERDAGDRCGYCLSSSRLTGVPLVLEHLTPVAEGGVTTRENLWLSCYRCNEFKGRSTHAVDPVSGAEVLLFNPRRESWAAHFQWSVDGTRIVGVTPIGRATVEVLRLNNDVIVAARRRWVAAGWHPPR